MESEKVQVQDRRPCRKPPSLLERQLLMILYGFLLWGDTLTWNCVCASRKEQPAMPAEGGKAEDGGAECCCRVMRFAS